MKPTDDLPSEKFIRQERSDWPDRQAAMTPAQDATALAERFHAILRERTKIVSRQDTDGLLALLSEHGLEVRAVPQTPDADCLVTVCTCRPGPCCNPQTPDAAPPLGEGGLYGTFARYAERFGKQTRTVEVTLTPAEICQIRDALSTPSASAGPQAEAAWSWLPIEYRPLLTGTYLVGHRGHQEILKFFGPEREWLPGTQIGWQRLTNRGWQRDEPAERFHATHCIMIQSPGEAAHPQPQQTETCQVIQGYPLCRDSCAKVGKCLHAPKPQQADGRGAAIRALSQAPATDGAAVTRPNCESPDAS